MKRSRREQRVRVGLLVVLVAGGLVLNFGGCTASPDARYVYQDGEYGVVGIPRNSPYGRKHYDDQARELMTRHFPEGYEIVRAEEVVAGERTLDTAIKKELETDPGFSVASQMLKIGKLARSSAIDEKDVTHITESRIIYRRKVDGKATGTDGFAHLANQSPTLYLDPNDLARKADKEVLLAAQKMSGEKDKGKAKDTHLAAQTDEKKPAVADASGTKDDGLLRAGHDAPPANP